MIVFFLKCFGGPDGVSGIVGGVLRGLGGRLGRILEKLRGILDGSRPTLGMEVQGPSWARLGESTSLKGDFLWFGNILVNHQGELSGIIDFDRTALAPADYELDMLLRFWNYPWNFVPEQLEETYNDPLDTLLLKPFLELCQGDLSDEALNARLSALELVYRLNLVNRFGWNDQNAEMFDRVLAGDWAKGLV